MLSLALSPTASPRLTAYALCLVILLPSLSFAAYLIREMHSQELTALHRSAESRALLAASFFNERMTSLVGNLKELAGTPATASERVSDRLRLGLDQTGIVVFSRGANLDLLTPASGADAAIAVLDAPARTAAAAALSSLVPQVTPYGAKDTSGITLWIASSEKNATPVLLQARVPSAYLASDFKNFLTDGPWSLAVVGADGRIYAEASGKPLTAAGLEAAGDRDEPLVKAFADTSQFGWRIAASLPDRALEIRVRRNWMTFMAISSLLVIASFTGATLLTRSMLEEETPSASPLRTEMPPSADHRRTSDQPPASAAQGRERMRSALRAANIGVWEWNLETGLVHWDAEIARIFDRTPDSANQRASDLLRCIDKSDRRRLLRALATTIDAEKPLAVETRVRLSDDEIRWIAIRGTATESESGRTTGLRGVAYDITDQKLSLTRTDALLREVSHRSKNLLALILAMARLTARDAVDVKSHLKDFTLRVAGLAASQDLIVASDWQSVDLATLASAEIGAVARTDADRVSVSGPPVMLTPEAAQTLGMVLTELALNAVEHGALSSATGEVSLSWTFPDSETIAITWRETGGPPFPADGPKGYGRSVVERFSTQGLKLTVRATSERDSFKWVLTGPLANIGTRPGNLA